MGRFDSPALCSLSQKLPAYCGILRERERESELADPGDLVFIEVQTEKIGAFYRIEPEIGCILGGMWQQPNFS